MDALEERTGVSKRTISEIERGMRTPQTLTLAKLANALDVSLDELLEEESPKAPSRSSREAPDDQAPEEERRSPYLEAWERYIEQRSLTWLRQAKDESSPFFADWKVAMRYVGEVTDEAFALSHTAVKKIWPVVKREAPSVEWELRESEALTRAIKSIIPVLEELRARQQALTTRAASEEEAEGERREIERARAEADRLANERREAFEVLQGSIGA